MSKTIPLTQGQTAIVCDCHAHLVEGHKWFAQKQQDGRFYAKRGSSLAEKLLGAGTAINMHVVINCTPRDMQTDHVNRNTLDNRCVNLRSATPQQNQANKVRSKGNNSGYKGVYWNGEVREWYAQITVDGKTRHVGIFKDIKDAARAYDRAAKKHFGEFARLNGV